MIPFHVNGIISLTISTMINNNPIVIGKKNNKLTTTGIPFKLNVNISKNVLIKLNTPDALASILVAGLLTISLDALIPLIESANNVSDTIINIVNIINVNLLKSNHSFCHCDNG